MDINYKEIANVAVMYAKQADVDLDFSEESIEQVEYILGIYYDHLDEYNGKEGKDTLWNIAVYFGIYLGETMLNTQLKDKGYEWGIEDGMSVLKNGTNTHISPISKAYKRILNGPEDSVINFCNVAFSVESSNFLSKKVHRAINIALPSEQTIENVLYKDIYSYISLVEKGYEDFIILNSHDGFLQFFGIDNQFIMEIRVNLQNNDFRTYSIINNDKECLTEKVQLNTPYGQFTPQEREVISLELVKTVIKKYYENVDENTLLEEIPYTETTEELKRCMRTKE